MAVALHVTHRKINLLTNIIHLEDWLEDLIDSRDRLEFVPFTEL